MASITVSRHTSLGIFHVPSPTTGIFAPLRSVSGSIISMARCPSVRGTAPPADAESNISVLGIKRSLSTKPTFKVVPAHVIKVTKPYCHASVRPARSTSSSVHSLTMRTKQPVRAKRDHFMHRDCVESEALQHNKPLHAKHKQPTKLTGPQPLSGTQVRPEGKGRSPWPSESPTSVLAPGSTPTSPLTLPVAVVKPSLPSTAVWGGHMPMLHLETATAAAKVS